MLKAVSLAYERRKAGYVLGAVAIGSLFSSPALPAQQPDLAEMLSELKKQVEQQQKALDSQDRRLKEQDQRLAAQEETISELRSMLTEQQKEELAAPQSAAADTASETSVVAAQSETTTEAEEAKTRSVASADIDDGSRGSRTLFYDSANTLYDPEFKGAWVLPGSGTAMRISGFVDLSAVNSLDPLVTQDRFIVGSIPPDGESAAGARTGTVVTATASRVNLETREQTRYGDLRTFLEADFKGSGETFRLRHAYGQFRDLLAGKTWTGLMDLDSSPEDVDYEGLNGQVFRRQAQIRYFPEFGKDLKMRISFEDPTTDVTGGSDESAFPDLVIGVERSPFDFMRQLGDFWDWNARAAIILRELKSQQTIENPDGSTDAGSSDSTFGWGATISGRKDLKLSDYGSAILGEITYGKGVGRYINDLGTIGGGDAVFDESGGLRALPVFAGYASLQYGWPTGRWPGTLRSNLTYSWVSIDAYEFQDPTDYKSTHRATMNIVYYPVSHARIGAEFLWGERKNVDGSIGAATQFQFQMRYSF